MKIVIFGLTVSSSWGNGHATLWRGLCRALARHGHRVVFFERDVPYYAAHRDLFELAGGRLVLYSDWAEVLPEARRQLADAEVGMVTSYCPDGIAASELVLGSSVEMRVFYDLDTPVTLDRLRARHSLDYIGPRGLVDFDLVLSFTGGEALEELQVHLGARRVAPLYGSVDPESHRPVPPVKAYAADLSYLGTYAKDRQEALERLFIRPARELAQRKFLIGGAQYPEGFPWGQNIFFARHLPPGEHPGFFCSSRLTLNVTRRAMAQMGYCPSGRLFEAASCGTAILSDGWQGLESFFQPGCEILVVRTSDDVVQAMDLSPEELSRIGRAGRERTLTTHTAEHRASELEALLEESANPQPGSTPSRRAEPVPAKDNTGPSIGISDCGVSSICGE